MTRLHHLVLASLAIGGLACSADSKSDDAAANEVSAVEAAIEAAGAALADGDVEGFMDRWTDDGLDQVFHESSDAFVSNTGYYLGAKQYRLGGTSNTSVKGEAATSVAALYFRLVGVVWQFSLVKESGSWKIDGGTLTTTGAGDAIVVDVEFGESAIEFDASLVANGNIALLVHNSTNERHELNILTAPPDQDLVPFFEHPDEQPPLPEGRSMPEGFDFIGGVTAIDPGVSVTVLFLRELPSARYVMFCNAEGPSGPPHSELGEFAEFTIH